MTADLDDDERRAVDVLADAGLIAPLRLVPLHEGGRRPPMREDGPLPAPDELREAWAVEWALVREFIAGLDEPRLDVLHGEAPLWQGLLQLINHGTQHRSEAAVILTSAGASPGDLDIVRFNFERLHDVLD